MRFSRQEFSGRRAGVTYSAEVQGTTHAILTVIDALGYLDEIKVCVGYEIDGEVTKDFPVTYKLEKAKPVLVTLPGWKCDVSGITKYEDLPENCRNYIESQKPEFLIFDYKAENETDYYYIRVELTDGRFGWTSPIWITK